eukprot:3098754-Prymnesium_polylepis.1
MNSAGCAGSKCNSMSSEKCHARGCQPHWKPGPTMTVERPTARRGCLRVHLNACCVKKASGIEFAGRASFRSPNACIPSERRIAKPAGNSRVRQSVPPKAAAHCRSPWTSISIANACISELRMKGAVVGCGKTIHGFCEDATCMWWMWMGGTPRRVPSASTGTNE